ncbi:hypothetical protein AWW72_14895 [Acinetobacter sp. NRRL B-65365]|uniref:lysozyme n=1 Tax=Acinetobacter sp. NRRL B-65365 TaxID=1785092 RepID=UPI00079FEC28|nr:hypothetical protein [Acinetobacter sp. NRRL B-65365]KYQ83282.1 hypothetical protein AWW72_14895 [Acinetobacter sp. NRRL B-65365]
MSNQASGLPYDELGFLIGLKQAGRDVAKIDKNVEAIHDILLGLTKEFEGKLSDSTQQFKPKLSALEKALIDAQIKPVDIADLIKEQANPLIQSTVVLDRVAKSLEDLIDDVTSNKNAPISKTTQVHQKAIEIDSPESAISESSKDETRKQSTQLPKEVTPRTRDSKGRFIGDGSIENENKSKLGKVIQTIGTAFKEVMPNNPQGVDPTVDAINEVATVLSPVKRAAGFMLRPLTGWMKSRKRNEPLPKEQSDHNRKQIKLLQRLVDSLQSKGGLLGSIGKLLGAGGGVLGSLFVGILKNGGKLLKFGKGLPVIGALLTAMSFSNWGTKSTKEKGGAVGSTAGGIIGGAVGSIFGPIGTVAGAGLGAIIGEKIGSVAAPYIKQWTDSLIAADIPSMISKLISAAFSLTPGGIAKSLADWGKEKWNSTFNGQPNPSYLMRRQYGGKGVNGGEPVAFGAVANSGKLSGRTVAEKTKLLIRKHEGFKENAYWDVNAYRVGYGSDTTTDKNGKVSKVSKTTTVDREGAERDLVRRSQIFANEARKKVGAENWDKLPEDTKAALTSVAYNYGSLPKRVVKAVQTGDMDQIAESVRNLEVHNDGINKNRRNHEADIIKNSVNNNQGNDNTGLNTDVNKAINLSATTMVQSAKGQVSMLSKQAPVTPLASRPKSMAAAYNSPIMDNKIEPSKEFFSPKEPQKVQVVGQNNGSINQNVSNRVLAHAITGGLGMGEQWNA